MNDSKDDPTVPGHWFYHVPIEVCDDARCGKTANQIACEEIEKADHLLAMFRELRDFTLAVAECEYPKQHHTETAKRLYQKFKGY